jgi:hypothetical protein
MPDEVLGWCYSAFFAGMPTPQLTQYAAFMADHDTHNIKSLADFRDKYTQVIASFHAHNFAEQYAALWPHSSMYTKPLARHSSSAILQYFAALYSHLQIGGDDQVQHQIAAIRTQTEHNTDQSAFLTELRDWIKNKNFSNRPQPMRERPAGSIVRNVPTPWQNTEPHEHSTNLARLLDQMHVLHQTQ